LPSGLAALLDDVATIAKMAAASVDDVSAAAGRASAKAAGVVIDDAAVTPGYAMGFSPDRELPIIRKIAIGSLRNKFLILLPGALLISAFVPWALTPLLMLGGAYLCFEASEKLWEKVSGHGHGDTPTEELALASDEREAKMVGGAIRTDLILSAEITAIALADLTGRSLWSQGVVLALVSLLITVAVYGVVALIVKMDDIGLHLTQRPSASAQALGRGLVRAMPVVLAALASIGTLAMLWVGGRHHRPWLARISLGSAAGPGRGSGGLGRAGSGRGTGDRMAGGGGGFGRGGPGHRRHHRRDPSSAAAPRKGFCPLTGRGGLPRLRGADAHAISAPACEGPPREAGFRRAASSISGPWPERAFAAGPDDNAYPGRTL